MLDVALFGLRQIPAIYVVREYHRPTPIHPINLTYRQIIELYFYLFTNIVRPKDRYRPCAAIRIRQEAPLAPTTLFREPTF